MVDPASFRPLLIPLAWPESAGLRNHFGLPPPAARLLDQREALGLDPHAYLLHLRYERSIAFRERGPGFDAKQTKR